MAPFSIRKARPGDEETIFALLYDLAEYEKLLDKFHITREVIARDYLSERAPLNCDLAFEGETPAGVMTWYWIYASFAARRAIYLEDLFVRPEHRGKGYGRKLLAHLARTAVAADAVRIDWSVLDWNKPSIDFYESIGARRHDGWLGYRLSDEALQKMGRE